MFLVSEVSIGVSRYLVFLRRWTRLMRGSGEQFLRGLSRIFGGPGFAVEL